MVGNKFLGKSDENENWGSRMLFVVSTENPVEKNINILTNHMINHMFTPFIENSK